MIVIRKAGLLVTLTIVKIIYSNFKSKITIMEKYILLFRGGIHHAYNANESQEGMEHMQAWMNWMRDLQLKGSLVSGDPLLPSGKLISGSGKKITDGAYSSKGEQVGGYLIVSANNLDQAVEIAKDCPIFKEEGNVEVRALQKIEM